MTITEIHALRTFAANCYIVQSREGNAFLVDPGAEAENIIGYLREHSVTPKMILLTHGHFDHIGAVKDLKKEYPGLPVYLSQKDQELLEGCEYFVNLPPELAAYMDEKWTELLSADERYSRMLMPLVMLGCVIATVVLNTARAVRKSRGGAAAGRAYP